MSAHITDPEIQLFILEEEKCDVHIVEHIRTCSHCATKVAEYKMLFTGIEEQEKPAFDFPLVDLVMEQLPTPQTKNSFDRLFLFVITIIAVVFGATVLYLFKDMLLDATWKISSISVWLIITTIVCVLVFLVSDMYRKYQKQMNAIDFIK